MGVAFLVLASVLLLYRHAKIERVIQSMPENHVIWETLVHRGFRWLASIIIFFWIAVSLRIASPWRASLFAIAYGMAGFALLRALYRNASPESERLKVLVGMAVGPLVMAWFIISTIHNASPESERLKVLVGMAVGPLVMAWFIISTIHVLFLIGEAHWQRDHDQEHANFRAVRAERVEWRAAWEQARRPHIAVTLSGGGYRAALAHAGVLWVLDEANIPIHALSTVSGGSIVGAAYALGWRPADFTKRLCGSAPGLPNMLLNFYPFMAQMLLPWWSSGDTYRSHFALTYFHNHTLDDTGPPDLIVNTTHYERGQRVAFWKDSAASTELARVVAASGAFPVFFEPVSIGPERYMDGGVVENLGLEGLVQYLEETGQRSEPRQAPPLLIVSDLSAEPQAPRSWQKPSFLQMASHSTNVTYHSLHARIFDIYSDGAYGCPLQEVENEAARFLVYTVDTKRFWRWTDAKVRVKVVLLRPMAHTERWRFRGDDEARIQAVTNLETLKELSPAEIDNAVYVGAKLASTYLPGICETAKLDPCPRVELRSVPRCGTP